MTPEDIARRFAHHPPQRPGIAELHSYLRERIAQLPDVAMTARLLSEDEPTK